MAASDEILLIECGGTIQRTGRDAFDLVSYGESGRHEPAQKVVDELVTMGLAAAGTVVSGRAIRVRSSSIGPDIWSDLYHLIMNERDGRPVVVTHGTATLEDTAYFLHLCGLVEPSVVLVGSLRPLGTIGSDAHRNLADGIRVAAGSRGRRGVFVVTNGEIHSGRDVTKARGYGLDAFRSPVWGPVGYVDPAGGVIFGRDVPDRRLGDLAVSPPMGSLPRVDVVASYPGADGSGVAAAVSAGAVAIVVEGLVPGVVPEAQEQALVAAASRGILPIVSSRGFESQVMTSARMLRHGFVAAGRLSAHKARTLAMLALQEPRSAAELQEIFDAHGW